MSHQCLDALLVSSGATSDFKSSLVVCLSKEAKNCTDVHRLFACIDVALGLVGLGSCDGNGDHVSCASRYLNVGGEVRNVLTTWRFRNCLTLQDQALAFACAQLLHKFPRVRRYAAEHIYVCLLEHPDLFVGQEENQQEQFVLESILEFPWDDAQMSVLKCRERALELSRALRVPLPEPRTNAAKSSEPKTRKDDFASYAALVDNATT